MRGDFSKSWLVDLCGHLVHSNDFTILDVGVNLGQTLLGLENRFGKNFSYIGFEPNPVCCYYVERLIEVNSFTNCILVPTALSSESNALEFIQSTDTDDAASIVSELRPDKYQHKRQYVAALKFDDLNIIKDHSKVLVKIDVEGAELDVINGMRDYIRANRPIIICEVLHAHSADQLAFCRNRNAELLQLLSSDGYMLTRIIKGSDQTTVVGFDEIDVFDDVVYNSNSGNLCDYVFFPSHASIPNLS